MDKIIYLKFGELALKGKNRKQFARCLFNNIKKTLSDFDLIYKLNFDSIEIFNINEKQISKILKILKMVSGIAIIIVATVLKRDVNLLHKYLKNNLKNETKSFKIITNRKDKKYEVNSMDFSKELGSFILENFNKYKVDIRNPEIKIYVEINTDNFIIYFDRIKGLGGLPLGVSGRVLLLLSGGIDSPVAAHLLMKRGFKVDFLTFISPPHTSIKALNKTKKLAKIITLDGKLQSTNLFVCTFTSLQHEISHISNHSYQIIIMRRYFFKIAQQLAKDYKYDAIATGESLGQVASQTIESMTVISSVLKDLVVLRPLLTYDKIEIIDIANKIGTYETSILPFVDACSAFLPANPITKPKLQVVLELESQMLMGETIFNNMFKKHINKLKLN